MRNHQCCETVTRFSCNNPCSTTVSNRRRGWAPNESCAPSQPTRSSPLEVAVKGRDAHTLRMLLVLAVQRVIKFACLVLFFTAPARCRLVFNRVCERFPPIRLPSARLSQGHSLL